MRKLGCLAVTGLLVLACGHHKNKGKAELAPGTTEGRDISGADAMLQGTWYMMCVPWSVADMKQLPAEAKAKTELWVFKDHRYAKTMTIFSDGRCEKALVSYRWENRYRVDMASAPNEQPPFYISTFKETTDFTAELLDKDAKVKAPCIKDAVLKDKVNCSYQGDFLISFKIEEHRLQFEGKGPRLDWMAGA